MEMKLKACNRIGLVLAGGWILGLIIYTSWTPYPLIDWIVPYFKRVALVSVAAYALPFAVRWILKGFHEKTNQQI